MVRRASASRSRAPKSRSDEKEKHRPLDKAADRKKAIARGSEERLETTPGSNAAKNARAAKLAKASKAASKEAASKKAAPKKPASKKAASKKAASKKAASKKAAPKKPAPKEAASKKAAPKKPAPKEAASKKPAGLPKKRAPRPPARTRPIDEPSGPAGMEDSEREDEEGGAPLLELDRERVSSRPPARRRKPKPLDEEATEETTGPDLDEFPDFTTDVGDPDDFL